MFRAALFVIAKIWKHSNCPADEQIKMWCACIFYILSIWISICCYSVAKSCLTLCDPMDCSTPGSSVLHYLPELAQIYVHWVSDAIKPSYPLSPPSPPALSLSQHQDLFQRISFLCCWPKYWSFSINPCNEYLGLISFRMDWLDLLVSPRDSGVFSNTTVQKH